MATRAMVPVPGGEYGRNARLVSWSGMLNGDDGEPLQAQEFADLSVSVIGTPGVGLSFNWEGSNVPTPTTDADWFVLTDAQGSPITKSATFLEQVAECCLWMRPHITAGDGATALTVYAYLRRARV